MSENSELWRAYDAVKKVEKETAWWECPDCKERYGNGTKNPPGQDCRKCRRLAPIRNPIAEAQRFVDAFAGGDGRPSAWLDVALRHIEALIEHVGQKPIATMQVDHQLRSIQFDGRDDPPPSGRYVLYPVQPRAPEPPAPTSRSTTQEEV